jgi:hypothetical protein
VPKFIDPVFAKSQKRSFSLIENARFGLVFANTGSINSGTGVAGMKLNHQVYFQNGLYGHIGLVLYAVQKTAAILLLLFYLAF